MPVSVTQIAPNDNQRIQDSSTENTFGTQVAMIVSAYIGQNAMTLEQLPDVIRTVAKSLRQELSGTSMSHFERSMVEPAVPVSQSIVGEYLVCLEDGKKMRMLKRYLRTQFGMTPEQYRAKWSLPASYPMTAPGYSKKRSDYAKQFGLGRQPGQKAA